MIITVYILPKSFHSVIRTGPYQSPPTWPIIHISMYMFPHLTPQCTHYSPTSTDCFPLQPWHLQHTRLSWLKRATLSKGPHYKCKMLWLNTWPFSTAVGYSLIFFISIVKVNLLLFILPEFIKMWTVWWGQTELTQVSHLVFWTGPIRGWNAWVSTHAFQHKCMSELQV